MRSLQQLLYVIESFTAANVTFACNSVDAVVLVVKCIICYACKYMFSDKEAMNMMYHVYMQQQWIA